MSVSSLPITYYIQTDSVAGQNGKLIKKGFTNYRVRGVWEHTTPPNSIELVQTQWEDFDVDEWVIGLGYTIPTVPPSP
tara:strand:+ start:323 stop:556 length:234 start_codon:yes stop_codon:yes gene_type:complete